MHDQDILDRCQSRYRHQVPGRIVIKASIERRADRDRGRSQQEGIAIGRRFGRERDPQVAAGARPVVRHHILPEQFGELLTERPAQDVARRTGRKRQHESDWLVRISLSRACRGGLT